MDLSAHPAPRLSLELVPSSCWYSNVRSNVTSATWDRIQNETAVRGDRRCQICGGQGTGHPVEAHEIWFYDDSMLIQRLGDIVALCPRCHEVKHFGHAMKAGRGTPALEWLAHVNSFTPHQALLYVRRSFEIHAARSKHQWRLDLALLTRRFGIRLDPDFRELT